MIELYYSDDLVNAKSHIDCKLLTVFYFEYFGPFNKMYSNKKVVTETFSTSKSGISTNLTIFS